MSQRIVRMKSVVSYNWLLKVDYNLAIFLFNPPPNDTQSRYRMMKDSLVIRRRVEALSANTAYLYRMYNQCF